MAQGSMASLGVLAPEGAFAQNRLNEDGWARHACVSQRAESSPFWLSHVIEGRGRRDLDSEVG